MISVAYPWVLVALLLPLILWLLLPKAKIDNRQGLNIPFYMSLQENILKNRVFKQTKFSFIQIIFMLIYGLLVISGMGIQWLGQPISLPQSGRELMLAIDLSGSMRTPDMLKNGQRETRIQVVKQVASDFITERKGDRVGLILFGSKPYLQTPLTFDRTTVSKMLKDATVGLAGVQTAIGDAIGLAVKQLMHYPKKSRALILLTDGANNTGVLSPLQAAKIAKEEHIKIYTIGLGAKQITQQTIFGPRTINPSSDLDVKGLKEISKLTGGEFFRADSGQKLSKIYREINELEPVNSDKVTIRKTKPFYPWTLGLALIFSFLATALWLKKNKELQ